MFLAFAFRRVTLAQRGGQAAPPPSPKAVAPIDITGYWVSVVTEDWRYRMVTPKKGDYPSIPLNAAGRQVADAWDPAKDEAAGNQCKAFGAGGVIRMPGRLHITWENDNALRIDTEAGTQTRVLRFGAVFLSEPKTWQGNSQAQWQFAGGRRAGSGGGTLKVVTMQMKAGFLQKNGVPYSENAVLTEYFDLTKETNGDQWLIVVAVVEDPQYLTGRFVRSTHFKKIADGSEWKPTPCSAR
jgi:hypothetical protein